VLASHLPGLRGPYQHKCSVMENALAADMPEARWGRPKGGFFIWLELPHNLNGEALLPKAIEHRVLYVSGASFFVEAPRRTFIRLAFSGSSPTQIIEGIARLARAVRASGGVAEQSSQHGDSAGVPGPAISSSARNTE